MEKEAKDNQWVEVMKEERRGGRTWAVSYWREAGVCISFFRLKIYIN